MSGSEQRAASNDDADATKEVIALYAPWSESMDRCIYNAAGRQSDFSGTWVETGRREIGYVVPAFGAQAFASKLSKLGVDVMIRDHAQ